MVSYFCLVGIARNKTYYAGQSWLLIGPGLGIKTVDEHSTRNAATCLIPRGNEHKAERARNNHTTPK